MINTRSLAKSKRSAYRASRDGCRGASTDYSRRRVIRSKAYGNESQNGISGVPPETSLAPMEAPEAALAQSSQEIAADGVVQVTFWLHYQAEFGQRICVVGNCVGLGMWQHKAAPEMQWNDGHQWSVSVEVPASQVLEYKYVILQPDGLTALHWQSGNNAVLALLADDSQMEIFDNWYDPASSMVAPMGRPRTTRSDRLALWANQMSSTVGQLRGELRTTRMSVFEAQQGMREALEQVKQTQDCLSDQVEENQKMAEQVIKMQEKNRKMRLQLIESQTLFKEVMAEARAIIMSTIENPDDTSDDELLRMDVSDLIGLAREVGADDALDAAFAAAEASGDPLGLLAAKDAATSEASSDDLAAVEGPVWAGENSAGVATATSGSTAEELATRGGDAAHSSADVQQPRRAAQREVALDAAAQEVGGFGGVQGVHQHPAVVNGYRGEAGGEQRGPRAPAEAPYLAPAPQTGRSRSAEGNGARVVSVQPRGRPVLSLAERRAGNGAGSGVRRMTVDLHSEATDTGGEAAAQVAPPPPVVAPVNELNEPPPPRTSSSAGGAVKSSAASSNGSSHKGVEPPVAHVKTQVQARQMRWATASGHVTPKNGYAPRRTSRRAPVTLVPMPEPQPVAAGQSNGSNGAAASPYAGQGAATTTAARAALEVVAAEEAASDVKVDAATSAASLKKVLRTKAVPATEAAGALLEAQVKLEAGLDGNSSGEDLDWLTDQAESLLSVFEQLEMDVSEAQEAVGRVMSTDVRG